MEEVLCEYSHVAVSNIWMHVARTVQMAALQAICACDDVAIVLPAQSAAAMLRARQGHGETDDGQKCSKHCRSTAGARRMRPTKLHNYTYRYTWL